MTTRCNLIVFTNEFPPEIWGGLGIAVHGLCNALQKDESIQLLVITRSRTANPQHDFVMNSDRIDGIKVIRVLDGNPTIKQLRHYCDPEQYDLVHTHGVHFATQSIAFKENFRLPLVYTLHSNALIEAEFDEKLRGTDVPPQNALIAAADRIIVQSKASAADAVRSYPTLEQKLTVIANGVPDPIQNTRAPHRDLTSKQIFTCLYIGRFHPRKGIDILMQAIPLLHNVLPSVRFIFIGGHSSEYAKLYRDKLQKWSQRDPRIILMDWLATADLLAWYRQSDTVIIPSLYEPFGNTAVEALAMGLPVIASDVGGLQEIIKDGINGYLVQPADPALLSKAIISLFSDPQKYAQMSRWGVKSARSHYNWIKLSKQYIRVYQSVMKGSL